MARGPLRTKALRAQTQPGGLSPASLNLRLQPEPARLHWGRQGARRIPTHLLPTWLLDRLPRAGQAPGRGLRRWSPSCLLLQVKTKQTRCAHSWLWVCGAGGKGGPPYRLHTLQPSPGALQLRGRVHTSERTPRRLMGLQEEVREKCLPSSAVSRWTRFSWGRRARLGKARFCNTSHPSLVVHAARAAAVRDAPALGGSPHGAPLPSWRGAGTTGWPWQRRADPSGQRVARGFVPRLFQEGDAAAGHRPCPHGLPSPLGDGPFWGEEAASPRFTVELTRHIE